MTTQPTSDSNNDFPYSPKEALKQMKTQPTSDKPLCTKCGKPESEHIFHKVIKKLLCPILVNYEQYYFTPPTEPNPTPAEASQTPRTDAAQQEEDQGVAYDNLVTLGETLELELKAEQAKTEEIKKVVAFKHDINCAVNDGDLNAPRKPCNCWKKQLLSILNRKATTT